MSRFLEQASGFLANIRPARLGAYAAIGVSMAVDVGEDIMDGTTTMPGTVVKAVLGLAGVTMARYEVGRSLAITASMYDQNATPNDVPQPPQQ